MSEESPRYTQLSELPEKHRHYYQVIAKETVIVRWCPTCGKTWRIVRYAQGGVFTSTWEEVREP